MPYILLMSSALEVPFDIWNNNTHTHTQCSVISCVRSGDDDELCNFTEKWRAFVRHLWVRIAIATFGFAEYNRPPIVSLSLSLN